MKNYIKSKTIKFNAVVGILAALEVKTEVFASIVGPEYLPLVGMLITAVNIYLRSITTEPLENKTKQTEG
jgi:hypothetical protein